MQIWLDGYLGVELRRDGTAFAEGLCDFFLGGDHFGWGTQWLGKVGNAPFSVLLSQLAYNWLKPELV